MAKLPCAGRRNILVTSALPYVNNVPHLGNIIGSVLSADVFARYGRLRGYNIIYMCGTDEYGTATETKALEEKTSPKEICDKYHDVHKKVYDWFDIRFDKFGRTSSPEQTVICQSIFKKLLAQDRLYEDKINQACRLYCESCQRFLADRFVIGTCPKCGMTARGDQCEKCTHVLNPGELVEPKCKICNSSPHLRETTHLFLDLPKIKNELVDYVEKTSIAGGWSSNSITITNAWIRDGLKGRCITRDLKWGVPVPLPRFEDKVFYVWFDAPIGYISITANYTPEWEKWWKSEDVELFQFMGKDNVTFHTVIFPCTLLGTGERWTMMKTLSATEYLNYEGAKFSKSAGIGVFGNDAQDTNVPVEVWRYYLLSIRPEAADTFFSWADLQAKQNNELLKNLGNFVHRCLSFLAKPEGQGYSSKIPDAPGAEEHALTVKLAEEVSELLQQYVDSMEKTKLKNGLKVAMSISSLGNSYLQESEFWRLYKEDRPSCNIVVRTAIGLVKILATILEPFMPSFSKKVASQLGLDLSDLSLIDADVEAFRTPWVLLRDGHVIGQPDTIFFEMSDEEVQAYRKRFAGSQAERASSEEAAKKADVKAKADIKTKADAKPKKKNATVNAADVKTPVDIRLADIRVGRIVKVAKHPNADSLYVEEIDVGEDTPRTVVSGLVKFIPLEEMENRRVCVICNLKPAKMRGVLSQAMVLAASNKEETKVELVEPPEGAVIGERVTCPGYEGDADAVLKPKDWAVVQPDLQTSSELIAVYKGAPFSTTGGVCKVASLASGSIK
ncbi:hypothetical protein SELMODRAFT_171855 [Selaginella moellendorffii]|uniref:methionine--tRNA ligase n=1 Tax=Selaginella moellendorffii TaxID=88036 RepID=D8RJ17_SELML|nr:hypothetical protein SELMODRAFT_171855 [Selaginella moellendorffii]